MRISDWSSDVCSSDLISCVRRLTSRLTMFSSGRWDKWVEVEDEIHRGGCRARPRCRGSGPTGDLLGGRRRHMDRTLRSEEHTSELQSLMRISYAVFCLKKKINKHLTQYTLP